jgi:hypothetical protein
MDGYERGHEHHALKVRPGQVESNKEKRVRTGAGCMSGIARLSVLYRPAAVGLEDGFDRGKEGELAEDLVNASRPLADEADFVAVEEPGGDLPMAAALGGPFLSNLPGVARVKAHVVSYRNLAGRF